MAVRASQKSASRTRRYIGVGELFRHSNQVPERLLTSSELHCAFETLRVPPQTYANRLYAWPLHHEPVSHRDGCVDRRNLNVSADDRNQVCFGLSRRVRQYLSDETV